MKTFLRLLLVSAVLAPAAMLAASFEGKISSTMKTGKDQMNMVYNIKGTKVRIDMKSGPNVIGASIVDTTKKEMTVIMDEQKMYMTMAMPEAATKEIESRTSQGKLEKTNETEKILGYTATKYISTYEGTVTDMWLAEGLGNFATMSNNPMAGGGGKTSQGWESVLAGKELFPLRVVGKDKAGKESFRMDTTAIDKQSLPDSLFAVPAGYQNLSGMMKGMIPGAH